MQQTRQLWQDRNQCLICVLIKSSKPKRSKNASCRIENPHFKETIDFCCEEFLILVKKNQRVMNWQTLVLFKMPGHPIWIKEFLLPLPQLQDAFSIWSISLIRFKCLPVSIKKLNNDMLSQDLLFSLLTGSTENGLLVTRMISTFVFCNVTAHVFVHTIKHQNLFGLGL